MDYGFGSLDRPLRPNSDASPVWAGCVPAHVTLKDREEFIAFASKKFNFTGLNCQVHERNVAGLIFGIEKFHFEIVTTNLFGDKSHVDPLAAFRFQRWGRLLLVHNNKVSDGKSTEIAHSEFLSRFPPNNGEPVESVVYLVDNIDFKLLSIENIATHTKTNLVLRKDLQFVQDNWSEEVNIWNSRKASIWSCHLKPIMCCGAQIMCCEALVKNWVYQALIDNTPHETYVSWL